MSDSTLVQFRVADHVVEHWDEFAEKHDEVIDSRSDLIRTAVTSFIAEFEEDASHGIEEDINIVLDRVDELEDNVVETRELVEQLLVSSVTEDDLYEQSNDIEDRIVTAIERVNDDGVDHDDF